MGRSKNNRISAKERLILKKQEKERDDMLLNALKSSRCNKNHFLEMVDACYRGNYEAVKNKSEIDYLIERLFKSISVTRKMKIRKTFKVLLLKLYKSHCHKLLDNQNYVTGVFNLSYWAYRFVRDPDKWQRSSYNTEKQFGSLVRFCIAKYHVPSFMDEVWLSENQYKRQTWFVDIAEGMNIRHSKNLPFIMTKKMAHWFLSAPDESTVSEALRWCQVMGITEDQYLAETIAYGMLGRNDFRNENFWFPFIQFLAKYPMIERSKVNELIDFLAFKRVDDNEFNLKGRTATSLIRMSDDWHREISREEKIANKVEWPVCSIQGYKLLFGKDDEKTTFRIKELLNSKELAEEGKRMNHCVFSYAPLCQKRECAIFSLTSEGYLGTVKHLGTLEVSLKSHRIVQAKARFNATLKPKSLMVMKKWAAKEGLILNNYL